ncbi:hypothetical protein [uncultured Methanobrevibacter sp.]|uniref:hypothetical protein n=1 Tax=uncultured Methanobrevibacter sp. TaxID=253161 RepID=UPI0025D98115|nr:hypothetical protein [uncultured Methanobrevibacter sp.]
MNIEEMTLEEKLEYYQRQTHQLKKRRDDAIDKIEYLNGYIKELHQEINSLKFENANLQERNNRQKDTITKQQEQIDNYIDIKAKLNAKLMEYETKAEEYELSACGCGSKHNWIKKTALEEFKEELFGEEVKE